MQDRIFDPAPDGKTATVFFDVGERDLLEQAAVHIRELLTGGDETGDTTRLFPPAYGDDWSRQVEFDRIAKDQLSDSHVLALDTLLQLLDAKEANVEEIEGFLRAVNQIRLVFAKPLQLTDETTDSDFPESHELHDTWQVYLYFGYLQAQALDALTEMIGDDLGGSDDEAHSAN